MAQAAAYGGKGGNARTVLLYGNCQTPFVAHMLSALDDLNADYRFVVALNHTQPDEPTAPAVAEQHLDDVALVVWQHEDDPLNPAALALQPRLPRDCPVIRFPSFFMLSQWPFECPEPRGNAEPGFPWKRYPHGDTVGLQIAQAGLSGPLAVAAYLDLSQREMPNLQERLQRDAERMNHYDAHCDVKLADWVLGNFRKQQLFWTYCHVSEACIHELALRIAAAARPIIGGTPARARQCFNAMLGYGGIGGLQVPIHPVVADTLGLEFWDPAQTYLWYEQHWTFYDYIQRYIAYEPW